MSTLSVDQRLNQLSNQLQALTLKGSVVLPREAVAPATAVGMAVYWDTANLRWSPAIATSEPGQSLPSRESDVTGVISAKYGSSSGDIIVLGKWAADTMPTFVNDGSPGRYYLSPTVAGGWTKTRPSVVARPVGFVLRGATACDSRPLLFVAPLSSDWLNDHSHYEFSLTALPAGDHDPPEPFDAHAITNPDSGEPGWLPANHAIFGGNAPAGAKFGYNLSQHSELNSVWPPQPLAGVVLEQTSDYENTRLLGRVPSEYVTFDENGIWWMTDGFGHVPWPTNYDTINPDANYDVFSTEGVPAVGMHLKLSFVRTTLSTQDLAVRSLRPGVGSPITVKNPAGVDAVSGDLLLGLDLDLVVGDDDVEGFLVVKNFNEGEFDVGPVVEGLIAGTPSITLTSSAQRTVGPDTLHMGRVTVSLTADQASRELFPHISALGDSLERIRFDVPHLALPVSRKSSLIFRFHVPAAGMGAGQLKMRFRAVLYGTVSGTLDELDCSARVLNRPGVSPTPINATATSLPGFVTAVAVTADQAIELQSELFNIAHGDTVIVTITRNSGGSYAGEIGFVRTSGIVST